MSNFVYKLIPIEVGSDFITDADEVSDFLKSHKVTFDKVDYEQHDHIIFVDCGQRFEDVLCNHCKHTIMRTWGEVMDKSHNSGFVNRKFITPCCNRESDLADLIYYGDAGFARNIITILNPSKEIDDIDMMSFETLLGTEYKMIIAHY